MPIIFDGTTYKFCRNSSKTNTVWKCNDDYEKTDEISIGYYCKWLDLQYEMALPELSFRDAVGRYIRVYGKNNCDERHPLHYIATEKSEKACFALLKLFDAYDPLKEIEAEAHQSDAYKKAQTLQFIANITKKTFNQNQRAIEQITTRIQELSSGLEHIFSMLMPQLLNKQFM
ncbi:hypothetical protein OBV_31780 [Oscillibacter valericigenes Sjm18-20]|nr:hypothetical protein OBV_31780 [Oscillibacter valericigenes Sjm18-20]